MLHIIICVHRRRRHIRGFDIALDKTDERLPVGSEAQVAGIRRVPASRGRGRDRRRNVPRTPQAQGGGPRQGSARPRDRGHERLVAARALPQGPPPAPTPLTRASCCSQLHAAREVLVARRRGVPRAGRGRGQGRAGGLPQGGARGRRHARQGQARALRLARPAARQAPPLQRQGPPPAQRPPPQGLPAGPR